MAHAEPGTGPAAEVRGKCPVSHERPEDHLDLLPAKELLLRDEDAITGHQLAGWAPVAGGADEVVLGGRELRPPVLSGLGDGELQKPLGLAIVEPVHDPAGYDAIGFRVIGKDLDVHPLVDDLADLLLG